MPAAVFSMIGGMASTVRAARIGHTVTGRQRKSRIDDADRRDGTQQVGRVVLRNRPLPVWPTARPIGIPISAASAVATSEYHRCSRSRAQIPSDPHQLSAVVSHCHPLTTSLTGARSSARPGPRGEETAGEHDQPIGTRTSTTIATSPAHSSLSICGRSRPGTAADPTSSTPC